MKFNICKNSRRKFRKVAMSVLGMTAIAGLSSCESFYFEEGDCDPKYYVKYVFDMNMEWADAFSSQVNSVELFIFNPENGNLVAHYTENDPKALETPGYLMPIDVKPGTYDFVAWCGLSNNKENLFSFTESVAHRDQAHLKMARDHEGEKAFQNKQLNAVFHGKVKASLPDEQGTHVVTVDLIRDTNNITLSMQHISGLELTTDMFTVTMEEDNGHLNYDNNLIEGEPVEFRPWHVRSGNVDITTKAGENLNFFMAELSTSRLMKDRDPRINIVDNTTGTTVYSIPIVRWACAFRSQQFTDGSNHKHTITDDQEYLDRENNYNIMLYLDNKDEGGWTAAEIYINSWKVVSQGAEVQ